MTDVTHLNPDPRIEGERWREYARHPGYYVSDHGRMIGTKGTLLKQSGDYMVVRCGYALVKVHHAVAEAFIGPRMSGYFVLHKDDDRKNNHLSNLRYGTHLENSADARRNGKMALGEKHGSAVLNEEKVRAIRASANVRRKDLADQYGVSIGAIEKILNGSRWKHV